MLRLGGCPGGPIHYVKAMLSDLPGESVILRVPGVMANKYTARGPMLQLVTNQKLSRNQYHNNFKMEQTGVRACFTTEPVLLQN